MTLPENIKRIRKEKGLTQKKLGELCGIDEANIRKYESGKQNPKIETVERIAIALDCSSYDLRGIPKDSIFYDMTQIGDYIQFNRTNLGLSPKELSEKLGISIETLNCYEQGNLMPSREQLAKLGEIFYSPVPTINEIDISTNQSYMQETEMLNSILMQQKKHKPKREVHFSDLEPFFNKLNPTGKAEILKRLDELTHLKQYTDK